MFFCKRVVLVSALALTLACSHFAFAQQSGAAPVLDGVAPAAMAQIASLLADKELRSKAQQKIDSQLLYGARMSSLREAAPGVPAQEVNLRYMASFGIQLVQVDIRTNPADKTNPGPNAIVAAKVIALGGEVITNVPQFNAIRAGLPLAQLETLADLPEVRFIAPAARMERDTGSVTSEGDRTLAADTARAAFPLLTANVKVCVISDSASATGIANSIATGNLSAGKVTVLPGQAGSGADEGLAMMEIINDIAPGVQLFFATSDPDEATFAQNILNLRSTYGCDIMVDDIRYSSELPFQDGVIARAVNSVTAAGALYFASAGNSGNKTDGTSGTWVGDFVNGGAFTVPGVATAYEVHSFQTAPSVQNYNLTTAGGSSYALSLFWADPENGSTNDYDVFQLNAAGTAVVSSSTNTQNGTQNAYESTTLSSTGGNRVVVVRKVGAAARALYVSTGRGRFSINTNGFARGHSAAPNAIAVAAVPAASAFATGQPTGPFPGVYTGAQQAETFSSDGPARKFFNPDGSPVTTGNFLIGTGGGLIQQYPAVSAPDGVTTSVSGFAPFFGSSAAAPHAAAVAALVKAYRPTLTAAQIRTALTSTALDIKAPGIDADTGAGIVRPVNALSSVSGGAALSPTTATLVSESFLPANGAIDPGETVTVAFGVQNFGSANSVNDVASLQVGGGVTAPGGAQNYGVIVAGGPAVSRNFTFTAAPTLACGANISATMAHADGATNLGNLGYTLPTGGVGAVTTASYTGPPVAIPDNTPAGVNIILPVSGVVGSISDLNFRLDALAGCDTAVGNANASVTHTFLSDLAFKLTSPAGTTVTLIANRGGGANNYCTVLLDDDGGFPAASTIPLTGAVAGNFAPESPLSAFDGQNANGNWTLNVADTASIDTGTLNRFSLIIAGRTCSTGTPPPFALTAVQSRKTHGTVGAFDIEINTVPPITGAVTVEPRAIGTGHTIVFQFNSAITATGSVTSTAGSATAAIAGNDVVVTLNGIADNSRATVSLTNVNNAGVNAAASIGFLVGDVNNTRSVNSSDISGVKAHSGVATSAANFRFDVNANGSVSSADISAVKARSGLVLP